MKITASNFAAVVQAAYEAGRQAGFSDGWDAGVEYVVNGGETDAVGAMVPSAFMAPTSNN